MIATCHPHRGIRAIYEKSTGVLSFECCECDKWLCDIAVARDGAAM